VLRAPKALEDTALNHYTHLSWKGFCLFHAVGGKHNCALVLLCYLSNNLPHKPTRFRIHTCWGLVEKNDRRITNQCHRSAYFTLVSSRQRTNSHVTLCYKTKPFYRFLHDLISVFYRNSFEARIILNVLIYIHSLKYQIMLRRVTNQLASLIKVSK
jgi:hypothetical protein